MPTTKAQLKYLRIAPRKARLVADVIRGLPVAEARARLSLSPKRASVQLEKLLKSATANAKHNDQAEEAQLYVEEIKVDKGPTLKRWRPRARGSAGRIEKKTSHITLTLGTKEIKKQAEYTFPVKEKKEKKPKKVTAKGRHPEQHLDDNRDGVEGTPKHSEKAQEITKPQKETKGLRKFFRRKSI
jgi:large subunit ribosomal protein L22